MVGLLVLAVAPSIALFLFFYFRDKYKKEPLRTLLATFWLGAAALIPAANVSLLLERLTGWTARTPSMLTAFFCAMVIVGLVEEGSKFLVVRFYAYYRPEFDEPYDGIMYSVMAALGFATVENILYIVAQGAGTGVLRALLAVPSHAFDGVLMGYFIGEAKFARTRAHGRWLSLLGLGLAVFAHGLYDFIVFSLDKAPLLLLSLVTLAVLSWVIFFKATRHLSSQSPYRHPRLLQLHRDLADEASKAKEAEDNPPRGEKKPDAAAPPPVPPA